MAVQRVYLSASGNFTSNQGPGDTLLVNKIIGTNTTAGAATLTAQNILTGILRRTGPAAGFIDTFPSADQLLLAEPELTVGDSFELTYINGVAQAMTAAAGEGVVLGTNVNVAASAIRKYLLTILANGVRSVFQGTLINGAATVTGLTQAQAAAVQVGQGITGTNIPANTFILGVNATTGTLTMSANATGSGASSCTTFPRYQVDGLYAATA